MREWVGHRLGLLAAFFSAAWCYWLRVFPQLRRELRYWRAQAARIPDPRLRTLALETFRRKWCNVEGAAAFAVLAPAAQRSATITALVAFQAAYDYADTVAEQPAADKAANGRLLHQPLLAAFRSRAQRLDYYRHSRVSGDGGYLQALTESCRDAFHKLPCHALVRARAMRAAERIVVYQSLNHGGPCARAQLARWAESQTPAGSGLRWWETAAACASSLAVLALISAAADPKLTPTMAQAIEDGYHPWIGALHTLLDSLIDWREDERSGQPSLLDDCTSSAELAGRMQKLARASLAASHTLVCRRRHAVLLAGMVGVYLANPEARLPRTESVVRSVLEATGCLAAPSLAVLKMRRAFARRAPICQ